MQYVDCNFTILGTVTLTMYSLKSIVRIVNEKNNVWL